MSGHITERFDHDGMFRHHHASYTGDGYEEGEPIWWGHCEQFGGLKRDHRHTARAAAHPVEPEPAARYGPDYTSGRGPQIRRDGWHYGHCWRRWVEIEPDEVAPCICAEWPPDPVDEQREGERAYERGEDHP